MEVSPPTRASKRLWPLALVLTACDCSALGGPPQRSVETSATSDIVVFEGTCDASGAVPLDAHTFAVADDENDLLRVYSDRGGPPLEVIDIGEELGTTHPPKGKKKKKKKRQESDIEAATLLNERGYWLTSHARSKDGKFDPDRFRFFATEVDSKNTHASLYGRPYHGLLDDLLADPRLQRFRLVDAAEKPAKDPNGLNIEGMTALADGRLLLGFRGPRPDENALLVPLENPEAVMQGERARFGDPVLLPLGGRGIRGLSSWRGRTLVIAGSYDSTGVSALYSWDGVGAPVLETDAFADLNPEAFFTPETAPRVLLLSDDGEQTIDGKPCKRLKDDGRKRFRGVWVTPKSSPPGATP